MILLREVKPADLDKLYRLAEKLNTLNLPADHERLARLIARSQRSFGGRTPEVREREYVFVMIDPSVDQLIGTCMIIAQHGTPARPSVYFQVRREQKYSTTLERHFVHRVLQLSFDYDGPTEIGGLILDPAYRGHPLKLGKILSFARLLYIGMHRAWFRDRLVAELLPPLRADGGSDLWDHLGAAFTGLDYTTADRLSRENVEFIRSLFPSTPLYTSLLPEPVRAQIGQVGAGTKPVERMLTAIGFRYNDSIDPFDGGPTFEVETDRCEPIMRTHEARFDGLLGPHEAADGVALVGFDLDDHEVRFRAALVEYARTPEADGMRIRGEGVERLLLPAAARLGVLPMTGPNLSPL